MCNICGQGWLLVPIYASCSQMGHIRLFCRSFLRLFGIFCPYAFPG